MGDPSRILIIYAHPNPRQSRIQHWLRASVESVPGVEIRDLYELYPDFLINVRAEQAKLLEADLIIFQHPFYWYSVPPLLKEWMDMVLEYGFAYGEGGDKLRDKDFLQVLSAGGPHSSYQRSGYNRFSLLELLRPIEATASLCGWRYHHPFIVDGARSIPDSAIEERARQYEQLLLGYQRGGTRVLQVLDPALPHEGVSHE